MAWEFSGFAEVVDGSHDAFAEEILPYAVGHDPGSERMLRVGDPFGEFESSGTIIGNLDECAGPGGNGYV